MGGRGERDRLQLELWDAFHRKGCPVCSAVDAVTDGPIREGLRSASGRQAFRLCMAHTARMAAGDDDCGCAAAIRFIRDAEDWIREQINGEGKRPGVRFLVSRFRGAGARHPFGPSSSDCPACRFQLRQERKILSLFLETLADPDFDRAFRDSEGLCFRHLLLLHRLHPGGPSLPGILRTQLGKLEGLRTAITPHRFEPGRMGPPADPAAWERVKRLLGHAPAEPGEEGHEPPAGEDRAATGLSEPMRPAGAGAAGDRAVEAGALETEKRRHSMLTLQKQLEAESSRAAALHYRYFKAVEDNRTLQMHLAGAQALARSLEEQVARLKEELARCRTGRSE